MALNRCWPPICGPQTVIPSPCVLVGSAHVYRDLSPCQGYTEKVLLGHSLLLLFNFHFRFWSNSHVCVLPAVGASSLLKEKRTVQIGNSRKNGQRFAFILPPTSTQVLSKPGDYSCDEDFQFETITAK